MSADVHLWAAALGTLRAGAWDCLQRGVRDRHAAGRHPTLATASAQGLPQARSVVLRFADPLTATLGFYTHLRSNKVAEMTATPVAALHVWDRSAHLQIRLLADVTVACGDEVAEVWSTLREPSREAYRRGVDPGTLIEDSLDYESASDPSAFAVVYLHVRMMDLLHLGPRHRRAQFLRDDDWAGQWLSP
jgi:hypothetical protein